MKKLIMTVVALMGATTLFAQTDVVATFQQGLANAKAANYTEAIAQFQEVVDASWDIEEPDANQLKAIAGSKKFIVTATTSLVLLLSTLSSTRRLLLPSPRLLTALSFMRISLL